MQRTHRPTPPHSTPLTDAEREELSRKVAEANRQSTQRPR